MLLLSPSPASSYGTIAPPFFHRMPITRNLVCNVLEYVTCPNTASTQLFMSSSSSSSSSSGATTTPNPRGGGGNNNNKDYNNSDKRRKKYRKNRVKRPSEASVDRLRESRQAQYERLVADSSASSLDDDVSVPPETTNREQRSQQQQYQDPRLQSQRQQPLKRPSEQYQQQLQQNQPNQQQLRRSPSSSSQQQRPPPQQQQREKEQGKNGPTNIFSFEKLFPKAVWDDRTIYRDFNEVLDRDESKNTINDANKNDRIATADTAGVTNIDDKSNNGTPKAIINPDTSDVDNQGDKGDNFIDENGSVQDRIDSDVVAVKSDNGKRSNSRSKDIYDTKMIWEEQTTNEGAQPRREQQDQEEKVRNDEVKGKDEVNDTVDTPTFTADKGDSLVEKTQPANGAGPVVNRALTQMVEDRIYGYRRPRLNNEFRYDPNNSSLRGNVTSAGDENVSSSTPVVTPVVITAIPSSPRKKKDDIAIIPDAPDVSVPVTDAPLRSSDQALKVNADRLTFFARGKMMSNKLEEAEDLYEQAARIDPRDGRPYLGLARIAERRGDLVHARRCLKVGLKNSIDVRSPYPDGDLGRNPYLLQALGNLEKRAGFLNEAEKLYVSAAKSRPCHAAAWVSLAQLLTRKLRRGAEAGRACYESAEHELLEVGLPMSAHVYTAWGGMEYKDANDDLRARILFKKALGIDSRCSAAWLQLGDMESKMERYENAKTCFEAVLSYDPRNSRVLQAYALMEGRRINSKNALGLFERALKVRPRDGGVYQAYALYVAELGDIDAARDLLRRGTQVSKKHAPLWQAWGVLETRHGSADVARNLFQQGIWSCAQSSGGQSGGRRCARLWQAWGVLEAREGDHAAARRCFSRSLDADKRNVAAVTAWTLMEQELGLFNDARYIFERALKQFRTPTDEKKALWRAFEKMEMNAGNIQASQFIFQRAIRDNISSQDYMTNQDKDTQTKEKSISTKQRSNNNNIPEESNDVEIIRWKRKADKGLSSNVLWTESDSIEGKIPLSTMTKINKNLE